MTVCTSEQSQYFDINTSVSRGAARSNTKPRETTCAQVLALEGALDPSLSIAMWETPILEDRRGVKVFTSKEGPFLILIKKR